MTPRGARLTRYDLEPAMASASVGRPNSCAGYLPANVSLAASDDPTRVAMGLNSQLHLLHPRISYGPALYSVLRREEKRQ
jgi:hypothetical protein